MNLQSASNSNSIEENSQLSEAVTTLHEQNENLKLQLMQESGINQANAIRIKELKCEIVQRANEAKQWEMDLQETKKQLHTALHHNEDLKAAVADLKEKIAEFEQETARSDSCSQACQQEIAVCQDNLADLKEKLKLMKDILQKKNEEIHKLKSDFSEKCEILCAMKLDCERTKAHYLDDIEDLKHTVSFLLDFYDSS